MSVRTLQRRLESENSSLTELVAGIRKESAEKLLKQGVLSNEDIAHHLGYSSLSAFNRAFKQWFGMTPSEFKQSVGSIKNGQ